MADLFLALLHHPVLDKNGQIVTSAVTNMDIHDIARSATTYGVRRFYVATPIRALRALSERILEHWEVGYGSTYNLTRSEALALVRIDTDLDGVLVAIERETGERPVLVVTSARSGPDRIGYEDLRRRLDDDRTPYLLVFGTGWGLAPAIMERADLRLAPVLGPTPYNHLSVRSAAAIILDRLRGSR
ncbi:MAG: RNA methyltransferase [Deltaproteobacteria bacterium]|nr:RNA methyltransferase [Deltaproteobacteria bacterium]